MTDSTMQACDDAANSCGNEQWIDERWKDLIERPELTTYHQISSGPLSSGLVAKGVSENDLRVLCGPDGRMVTFFVYRDKPSAEVGIIGVGTKIPGQGPNDHLTPIVFLDHTSSREFLAEQVAVMMPKYESAFAASARQSAD